MRAALTCVLTIGLLGPATVAQAASAYVTDQGEFNLRSGESTRHKIIRILSSGARVEVLSENEETGYAKIRTQDGTIGYVLTRYLQDTPAARTQVKTLREQLEELQQEPEQLAAQLSRLKEEHNKLKLDYDQVMAQKRELEETLAELEHSSENIIKINAERNQLQQDVASLTRTLGDLEQENLALRNGDERRWFLTGAAVAGAGLLLGLILPRLGMRRRRDSRQLF
jgi:SH3 domain protein